MSITTKTGDTGKTFLLCKEKKFKDDLRVEACGSLDELCSFLGMSKSLTKGKAIKSILKAIQLDLFVIGSEIATPTKYLNKLKKRINGSHILKLEKFIERAQKAGKNELYSFCLPGENILSSSLDISRAIARRAERSMVTLKRKKILKNSDIIIYLNRLSDLLYLFARNYEGKFRKAG